MEFKGTKGKWRTYVIDGRNSTYFSIESANARVCNISSKRIELFKEEEANALLISKAPEMLKMLKSILASEHLKGTVEESKIKQLIKEATEI